MAVEFAKVVGTVGANDVAPAPALPNADVNVDAGAKADWDVIEDPPSELDAGDAELKALCEDTPEPKALCTSGVDEKALCPCAGAPNALCVGPAVGVPNDDCPNTDPCVGGDANADV